MPNKHKDMQQISHLELINYWYFQFWMQMLYIMKSGNMNSLVFPVHKKVYTKKSAQMDEKCCRNCNDRVNKG